MSHTADKPPEGYVALPKGAKCRCLLVWDDGKGQYYCCKSVGALRGLPPKKKNGKIVMRQVQVD